MEAPGSAHELGLGLGGQASHQGSTYTEGLKQLKDGINRQDLVHQGDDFSAGDTGENVREEIKGLTAFLSALCSTSVPPPPKKDRERRHGPRGT